MKVRNHAWMSESLGRQMPIVTYGEWGMPLLFFPTAGADAGEYERFGLIDAISPHIEAGLVKCYSIDSINKSSWLDESLSGEERARRQVAFDRYVGSEVLPFIAEDCRTPGIPITVTGASFGAFHAANTFLRHPRAVRGVIAMAGFYDIRPYARGYTGPEVAAQNPVESAAAVQDPEALSLIRSGHIHIITGQGAYEIPDRARAFSEVLRSRGIPHELALWGHDVNHDWPWWKIMLNVYIPRLFGPGGPLSRAS